MKTETLSKDGMAMFVDLETKLAADNDGRMLLALHNYLNQISRLLKDRLLECKELEDKKKIKKLEEAALASQQIICTVWKNFHPNKRLPV
ncbi:MAG: hypothetical protein IM326_14185 [Microcystis sp. M020S1]|jgi:hypothetical protein|nr:hypothetical protein [Microcystis sp. M020S1]